ELGRRHGGSEPDHSRFDQVLYALTPLFTKSHEVADAGLDKKRRGSGAEEWQNHKEKPHGTDTKKLLTVGEGGHQRCCHACRDGDGLNSHPDVEMALSSRFVPRVVKRFEFVD